TQSQSSASEYLEMVCQKLPVVKNILNRFGHMPLGVYAERLNTSPCPSVQSRDDIRQAVFGQICPVLGKDIATRAANDLMAGGTVMTTTHLGIDYFANTLKARDTAPGKPDGTATGTIFFWGIDDYKRRVPLLLKSIKGDFYLCGRDDRGDSFTMNFNRNELIQALEKQKLLPAGPIEIIQAGGINRDDLTKAFGLTVTQAHMAGLFGSLKDADAQITRQQSGWQHRVAQACFRELSGKVPLCKPCPIF
ncbi:MAG: hypothetical protein AB7U43_10835, partial [Desulfobacter sp.]